MYNSAKIFNSKFYNFITFLCGLAIPTSTFLQNLTIAIIVLVTIIDQDLRSKIILSLKNYFVLSCVSLYALFLLWVLKSQAPTHDILHMLAKMREYLIVPFLFAYFSNKGSKPFMYMGFAIGALISLLVSFGMFMLNKPFLSATSGAWAGGWGDWAAFRYHTYHNLFLAILAVGLIFFLINRNKLPLTSCKVFFIKLNFKSNLFTILSTIIILFSLFDIFYLVQGRAGQVICLIMLGLMILLWDFKKGILYCLMLLIITSIIIKTSPAVKSGLTRVKSDISNYERGDADSSVGARLEFQHYTKELIKKSPILGYGTGSFHYEYGKYTGFSGGRDTNHPHNDFYWLWVELGILGVINLLLVAILGIYYGFKLNSLDGKLAGVLSISYLVGALQGGFFTDNISAAAFMVLLSTVFAPLVFQKDN